MNFQDTGMGKVLRVVLRLHDRLTSVKWRQFGSRKWIVERSLAKELRQSANFAHYLKYGLKFFKVLTQIKQIIVIARGRLLLPSGIDERYSPMHFTNCRYPPICCLYQAAPVRLSRSITDSISPFS